MCFACVIHSVSKISINDDSGINSPGMSKWRNFPRPKRPLRCLFPLPVCNRDEFELRGKLLCEFAGFVLGALRFLYSVGSINYVCQKKCLHCFKQGICPRKERERQTDMFCLASTFASKISMNVRFGSFSIAIKHKIQKWFAIEISRMSASN